MNCAYRFKTLTLPLFTELHSQWYTLVEGRRIKVIPGDIEGILTPRAIAYWLAGDGYFNPLQGCIIAKGAYGICTDSFTIAEVDRLRDSLLARFAIESTRVLCAKRRSIQD
jgi:hypothetical protein